MIFFHENKCQQNLHDFPICKKKKKKKKICEINLLYTVV